MAFCWCFGGQHPLLRLYFKSMHFYVLARRILASCTELMKAIKELILSSKDLQRDIVESGRVSDNAVSPLFYQLRSQCTTGPHGFPYYFHTISILFPAQNCFICYSVMIY